MKLQRTKLQLDKRLPRSAIELIRVLGFRPTNERRRMQRDGFWLRNGHQLHAILWECNQLYRSKMKRLHPDRGGDPEDCVRLGIIWRRLRRIFQRNGITLEQ